MRAAAINALLLLGGMAACGIAGAAGPSPTLARVRAAGALHCGIDAEEAEYSTADDHGNRAAIDADLCRAVAVAVLGTSAKVVTTSYPDDRTSMHGLNAGEVDMIATLDDDFTHATGNHIAFTRPLFWDGVGFLVPGGSTVTRAPQLSGKKVCFLAETAVEDTVRAWFTRRHLSFVSFPFQEEGEMDAAFATHNCGALAGEQTRLAQTRSILAQHGRPARLLADSISSDPLAAACRDDDPGWAAIVNWTVEALIEAEESGITRKNVLIMRGRASKPQAGDPALRFLLGASHEIGSGLGLENDWVVHVIEATGNYGEIYARDLGSGSVLALPRDVNNLRRNGGVLIALPPR